MRTFALAACATLAALTFTALTFTSIAHADSHSVGAYSARDLVVSRSTLRLDAGPRVPMFPAAPMRDGTIGVANGPGDDDTILYLNVGATAGLTNDLEVGVLFLPLLLSPDSDYRDPVLHGTYRFTRGELEAGVFVGVDLPINDDMDITAGIPLVLHAGNSARVDLAALMHIRLDDDETPFDLMFPFELAFNVSPRLFLGPETGIVIANFDDVLVPLGFFLGYTVGNLGDLRGEFRVTNVGDGVETFQLLFRLDFYFDL